MTQVVPIDGALDGGLECVPGRDPHTYTKVVDCLQTRCQFDLDGDVLRLSAATGERVADLVRAAADVP